MENQLPQIQPDPKSISLYDQTLEQFKSLFYLVKGKRDIQIKLYNDDKSFNRNSLIELNNKIQEKLLLHSISNKLVNISVTLSNNHIKSYGNWNEFLNEKWDTSERTQSITLNWEFEMILPNRVHTLPQTHSLKVRLGRELKPNEFFHIMMVGGDEFEFEESQAQMVTKVDFVNATIASELLEKVNEWYNALPEKHEEDNINNLLNKNSRKLKLSIEILIIVAGLCLYLPIAEILLTHKTNFSSNDYLKHNFYLVAGIFLTFTIFTRIGSYYSIKLERKIDRLNGTPFFGLTNGDRNELAKILKKNKTLRREIMWKIIISLLSSGILLGVGKIIQYLFNNLSK